MADTLVRQKNWRKRLRDSGLVDIRVEVPLDLREALKALAAEHDCTLKEEVNAALVLHVNNRRKHGRADTTGKEETPDNNTQ